MRTRSVRVGNSQGIRIPRPFIEQLGLRGEVETGV
jgi:antitoxin component of MazEF toxin-antitoxin module